MRLDDVMDSLGIKKADFPKTDAEAHVLVVLRGAVRALTLAERLIIEVSRRNEETCASIVSGAGFRLVSKEPGGVTGNWLLKNSPGIGRAS